MALSASQLIMIEVILVVILLILLLVVIAAAGGSRRRTIRRTFHHTHGHHHPSESLAPQERHDEDAMQHDVESRPKVLPKHEKEALIAEIKREHDHKKRVRVTTRKRSS